MRILHVLDHSLPLHSGYVYRTMGLLRGQRELGWETVQMTTPRQKGASAMIEVVEGWTFFRTAPSRGVVAHLPCGKELVEMTATATRLSEVVRETRPDLLHAHSPVLNGIPSLHVGRKSRLPIVYELRALWEDAAVAQGTTTVGSVRYRVSRALETFMLRKADAVTTICNGLRDEIIQRGVDSDKITVIPNGVDIDEFGGKHQPDHGLRTSLGLDGAIVLGFIGSFSAYEGLDLLLQAFRMIASSAPNLRLLLVGGGPEDARLRTATRSLEIGDKVVFAGWIAHDRVQQYYDLVDVFVYPRRSVRLTEIVTPLKPLEAMAQRSIVLASAVGGHKELILDGVTGYLFRANDIHSLAERILAVISDRGHWHQVGTAARKFVEEQRTWRASVRAYSSLYARLIDGTRLG